MVFRACRAKHNLDGRFWRSRTLQPSARPSLPEFLNPDVREFAGNAWMNHSVPLSVRNHQDKFSG